MRKDAKEIKLYELPDYYSFIIKYPDLLDNEDEYNDLKSIYYSIDLTSVRLIRKFYREYWQMNRGKIPGKETPRLYQDFLIYEVVNIIKKDKLRV